MFDAVEAEKKATADAESAKMEAEAGAYTRPLFGSTWALSVG
jgi:hypothetical protein